MPREASSPPTISAERDSSAIFSRQQVLRLVHVAERQLRSWERQQLIPVLTEYRFSDLLMLKTIARLREEQVSPQRIRRSLLALKTRMKDSAFSDMRVYAQGNRVRVQIGKQKMEPISGQLLFDFHESEINKLFHLPERPRNAEKAAEMIAADAR